MNSYSGPFYKFHKNIPAMLSFVSKVASLGVQLYLKKNPVTGACLRILQNFIVESEKLSEKFSIARNAFVGVEVKPGTAWGEGLGKEGLCLSFGALKINFVSHK